MTFDNAGTGYALGSELSSEYQPFKSYRGRLSFEWGLSRRGDDLTRQDYSFAKFRDWKLKWFHHFQFGEKYALSLRFAAGRGFPYTGYWLPGATEKRGDTTLVVESRLNRHFSPYRRLDIRFSHKDTFWGLPTESYFEVWNAWNTPNAFLRDEQTAQLRSFDLNTPVPLLFGGWELSF